jgi:hypothetical protein
MSGSSQVGKSICFELELQPETATHRWHAVVRELEGGRLIEFDSPLELVRHLSSWNESRNKRGLR